MSLIKQAARMALAALLIAAAGGAGAQEGFHLTLGVKFWANYWETGFPTDDPNTGNHVIMSSNESPKVAVIPSLSMRWGRFVVSAGYFAKTEYEFQEFSDFVNTTCCGGAVVRQATKAEREEVDINIGWFVHPQVAVTLGYKQVDQTYTSTFTSPGLVFPAPQPSTTKNKAWTIGVLGSGPIGGGFAVYGNLAVGPMEAEFTDDSGEKPKGYYHSTEFGFAYGFGGGSAITLGYKVQVIDLEFGENSSLPQRGRDTTNGFIAGLSFTF
jgi:hypothetical protein